VDADEEEDADEGADEDKDRLMSRRRLHLPFAQIGCRVASCGTSSLHPPASARVSVPARTHMLLHHTQSLFYDGISSFLSVAGASDRSLETREQWLCFLPRQVVNRCVVSYRLIIAAVQLCIIVAVFRHFESYKHHHSWQKVYQIAQRVST
jgi:hypothetical protein